jgi:hypothetical protein
MKFFYFSAWVHFIFLLLLSATIVIAKVNDPTKDATPYREGFSLFRSSNMEGADKLSSGIGFHSSEFLLLSKLLAGVSSPLLKAEDTIIGISVISTSFSSERRQRVTTVKALVIGRVCRKSLAKEPALGATRLPLWMAVQSTSL